MFYYSARYSFAPEGGAPQDFIAGGIISASAKPSGHAALTPKITRRKWRYFHISC